MNQDFKHQNSDTFSNFVVGSKNSKSFSLVDLCCESILNKSLLNLKEKGESSLKNYLFILPKFLSDQLFDFMLVKKIQLLIQKISYQLFHIYLDVIFVLWHESLISIDNVNEIFSEIYYPISKVYIENCSNKFIVQKRIETYNTIENIWNSWKSRIIYPLVFDQLVVDEYSVHILEHCSKNIEKCTFE